MLLVIGIEKLLPSIEVYEQTQRSEYLDVENKQWVWGVSRWNLRLPREKNQSGLPQC